MYSIWPSIRTEEEAIAIIAEDKTEYEPLLRGGGLGYSTKANYVNGCRAKMVYTKTMQTIAQLCSPDLFVKQLM